VKLPDEVEVVIEVPRGSFVKRGSEGGVDYVSPVPCPFNYGSIPDMPGADGDAVDAVVLGPRLERGARGRYRVLGVVAFVDDGVADPKLVCGDALTPEDEARVIRFFERYARIKRTVGAIRGRGPTRMDGFERRC